MSNLFVYYLYIIFFYFVYSARINRQCTTLLVKLRLTLVKLCVCLLAVEGGDVTDHITGNRSDQLAS